MYVWEPREGFWLPWNRSRGHSKLSAPGSTRDQPNVHRSPSIKTRRRPFHKSGESLLSVFIFQPHGRRSNRQPPTNPSCFQNTQTTVHHKRLHAFPRRPAFLWSERSQAPGPPLPGRRACRTCSARGLSSARRLVLSELGLPLHVLLAEEPRADDDEQVARREEHEHADYLAKGHEGGHEVD